MPIPWDPKPELAILLQRLIFYPNTHSVSKKVLISQDLDLWGKSGRDLSNKTEGCWASTSNRLNTQHFPVTNSQSWRSFNLPEEFLSDAVLQWNPTNCCCWAAFGAISHLILLQSGSNCSSGSFHCVKLHEALRASRLLCLTPPPPTMSHIG